MPQLDEYLRQLAPDMTQWRRDFHLHAESGWLEFRTASKVAEILDGLGYQLALGRDVIDADSRMGLPDEETLTQLSSAPASKGRRNAGCRRLKAGSPAWWRRSTPDVPAQPAFRVDMDALDLNEQHDDRHRAHRDHFASCNAGMMHACGHDGHTAIGLGLAHVLKQYAAQLNGVIKLIFQPAEEGTRGARAMVAAGVVDEVDYFTAIHIGTGVPVGTVVCGDNFMATTKFDVQFSGVAAHAGGKPEDGRNALLAAARPPLLCTPSHRTAPARRGSTLG